MLSPAGDGFSVLERRSVGLASPAADQYSGSNGGACRPP